MVDETTVFVPMPFSKLLELFNGMLEKAFDKYGNKASQIPSEELMSIEETSKFLKTSEVTKKLKMLPFHRIGRRIYFKKQELIDSMSALNSKKK